MQDLHDLKLQFLKCSECLGKAFLQWLHLFVLLGFSIVELASSLPNEAFQLTLTASHSYVLDYNVLYSEAKLAYQECTQGNGRCWGIENASTGSINLQRCLLSFLWQAWAQTPQF